MKSTIQYFLRYLKNKKNEEVFTVLKAARWINNSKHHYATTNDLESLRQMYFMK